MGSPGRLIRLRVRRGRTFTAEYKARIVAEYEAAPHGEKSAVCGVKACSTPTSGSGRRPVTPAPLPDWTVRAARRIGGSGGPSRPRSTGYGPRTSA